MARSSSFTLQAKRVGLSVISQKLLERARSSGVSSQVNAGLPVSRCGLSLMRTACSAMASLSPRLASLPTLSRRLLTDSMSAKTSSVVMVSMSRTGSTLPATWWMSASSKQRTTCTMASTSRMWLKNLFPKPSPALAPFTNPAMSTNSMAAGITTLVLAIFCSTPRRSSGTVTMPTLGSMVQNG